MAHDSISKQDLEKFRSELIKDLLNILKAQTSPSHDEWVKGSSIKDILPISSKTIQRFRISGKLKFVKLGGSYYYKRSDIDKMLSS